MPGYHIVGDDSIACESPVEAEGMSEYPSASDDDVAADESVEPSQAEPEISEASPPEPAAVGKVEKVSSDDIAALFQAAQQPPAKPKNTNADAAHSEENKLQSKASTPASGGASNAEAKTMATADDIAALFAAVKETAKPVEEAIKTREPLVAEEAKKKNDEPALMLDKELSTAASGDDIAALFAAFKEIAERSRKEPQTLFIGQLQNVLANARWHRVARVARCVVSGFEIDDQKMYFESILEFGHDGFQRTHLVGRKREFLVEFTSDLAASLCLAIATKCFQSPRCFIRSSLAGRGKARSLASLSASPFDSESRFFSDFQGFPTPAA